MSGLMLLARNYQPMSGWPLLTQTQARQRSEQGENTYAWPDQPAGTDGQLTRKKTGQERFRTLTGSLKIAFDLAFYWPQKAPNVVAKICDNVVKLLCQTSK